MSPSPRPCRCSCTCGPGSLAVAELRKRAAEYAATLVDGDEIHESIDAATIAPFIDYLPEAISARGGRMLVRLDGRNLVTTVKFNEQEGRA
jgi:hypothetical protein